MIGAAHLKTVRFLKIFASPTPYCNKKDVQMSIEENSNITGLALFLGKSSGL